MCIRDRLEKSYKEYLEGFKDIATGEARKGYVEMCIRDSLAAVSFDVKLGHGTNQVFFFRVTTHSRCLVWGNRSKAVSYTHLCRLPGESGAEP